MADRKSTEKKDFRRKNANGFFASSSRLEKLFLKASLWFCVRIWMAMDKFVFYFIIYKTSYNTSWAFNNFLACFCFRRRPIVGILLKCIIRRNWKLLWNLILQTDSKMIPIGKR